MKIAGKVAVVVGGARGIGKAYCRALLQHGAKVCFGDVLEKEGCDAEREFRDEFGKDSVLFIKCDVTSEEDIENIYKKAQETFGKVMISVSNAGIMDEFNWKKTLDVNVGGIIRCTNEAMKMMAKNKGGDGGVIVNTSSVCGLNVYDFSPVYCASKHAVTAYTRAWALPELYTEHGIRVNCICPTTVETEIFKQVTEDRMYHAAEKREGLADMARKGILLQPADVAKCLIRLIEDDTMNGAALRISHERGQEIYAFDTDHPDQ